MKIFDIFHPDPPDITQLKQQKDIHGLINALMYKDLDIQWKAAEALGEMGQEGTNHLLIALQSRNKHVRLGVTEALGEIKSREAVEPLMQALHDPDNEVRWEAALALGEIGDGRAIPSLVERLKDSDRFVRYGAAVALDKFHWQPDSDTLHAYLHLGKQEWKEMVAIGGAAVEPLSVALTDHDSEIREKAIRALGAIGSEKAIPVIYRSLSDASDNVRWNAVKAAPRVGLSLAYLPRGLSLRPRLRKNPFIAGFLNFVLPGMGYFYLGKWWGIIIFQIDVYATTLMFTSNGEFTTYGLNYPVYFILAAHAYYMASKMPDL
ncbi:MAG: HEAT repeat domain-containing protein [Methanoregulaceae archaeon]|nr:HEAT repeat domain-containing protein [Methanoregulaceae archaeon]